MTMNKTLVGIVTFGNLPFTKLAVESVRATAPGVDLCVIVGKPGDTETAQWLRREMHAPAMGESKLILYEHTQNIGFAASCNDLVEEAFNRSSRNRYEHLILMGNDVIAYPNAIRYLVEAAGNGWDWCCSSQYDVASLCRDYAAAREHFGSEAEKFRTKPGTFAARPWDLHLPAVVAAGHLPLLPGVRCDVQNLCLYTRRAFEKTGYFDVNFWPNGYFSDNDFCLRGERAGVKACRVQSSAYFHFWSRTIHEGGGDRPVQFERNKEYYLAKWGGLPDQEAYKLPFNGVLLDYRPDDFHDGRVREHSVIEYWRNK